MDLSPTAVHRLLITYANLHASSGVRLVQKPGQARLGERYLRHFWIVVANYSTVRPPFSMAVASGKTTPAHDLINSGHLVNEEPRLKIWNITPGSMTGESYGPSDGVAKRLKGC